MKKKPLNKGPISKAMKMAGVGGLFEIDVVAFLKFGIIVFGLGVLIIAKFFITLTSVVINKRVNSNIANN